MACPPGRRARGPAGCGDSGLGARDAAVQPFDALESVGTRPNMRPAHAWLDLRDISIKCASSQGFLRSKRVAKNWIERRDRGFSGNGSAGERGAKRVRRPAAWSGPGREQSECLRTRESPPIGRSAQRVSRCRNEPSANEPESIREKPRSGAAHRRFNASRGRSGFADPRSRFPKPGSEGSPDPLLLRPLDVSRVAPRIGV